MSTYTIEHGSIAAVQYITTPEGRKVTACGGTKEYQPEFEALPLQVRAEVNKQFGIVLSLPYSKRQSFIDNSIPFTVEVTT